MVTPLRTPTQRFKPSEPLAQLPPCVAQHMGPILYMRLPEPMTLAQCSDSAISSAIRQWPASLVL
eukprot:scaffold326716_cov17-Prasinocladus_malaysianus.AAC.1